MAKINFVPDDYVQKKEARRANLMYIGLFLVIMVALASTFFVIKMRQRVVMASEKAIDAKLAKASEELQQLEVMQNKRKAMVKTALMTAELIEPVPRSVVLAALTNSLPNSVSLSKVKMQQKDVIVYEGGSSKYQSSKGKSSTSTITCYEIEIEGLSPSDIEVATYIASVSQNGLFDSVELTQSKEIKKENIKYRDFRLKTRISGDFTVTADDVETIKDLELVSLRM